MVEKTLQDEFAISILGSSWARNREEGEFLDMATLASDAYDLAEAAVKEKQRREATRGTK